MQILLAGERYQLQQLDMKLDDSHLTGAAEAQNPSHPTWKFDFALDQLDLDRYISAPKEVGSAAPPVPAESSGGSGMNGEGSVRIGKFKAFGMQLSDITLQIHARNGEMSLGPNTAKLYGGTYSGNSRIGPPGRVRKLQLDEKLSGIQIAPLLRDAAGIKRYSGSASVHLLLDGTSGANLVRGMTGTVDVNLANGKIDGFDLLKIVNQATALGSAVSKKQSGTEALPVIKSQSGDETLFTSLGSTMTLSGGVARTSNIRLKGSALEASGAGSADLIREVVDYKLQVTVKDSSGKNVTVPVLVSGSFNDPKFGVDIGSLVKQSVTKELNRQIDKLFKKKKPK